MEGSLGFKVLHPPKKRTRNVAIPNSAKYFFIFIIMGNANMIYEGVKFIRVFFLPHTSIIYVLLSVFSNVCLITSRF